MYRKIVIAALTAVLGFGAYAQDTSTSGDEVISATSDRVSATEKGSILIFPKIEVRWAATGDPNNPTPGELIGDTFIDIANDYLTGGVHLTMFYVNDQCYKQYMDTDLTASQPIYWAASSGDGDHINLNPFFGVQDAIIDPQGSGDFVMRGYLVVIATNNLKQPIRHNHLYGQATIVNYALAAAWEYNAYAFAALVGTQGEVLSQYVHSTSNGNGYAKLPLNGTDYDSGFQFLLLDYFASGSTAFSSGGTVVTNDTDLTLMILKQDLRQETEGPFRTKAFFDIWDEEEDSASFEFCFTKWTQVLLSSFGQGSPFDVNFLGTNKGRAVISGLEYEPCDIGCDYDQNNEDCIRTKNRSLLGVAAKILTFAGTPDLYAMAGGNLAGSGNMATSIYYDVRIEGQPEFLNPVNVPTGAPVIRFRR